MSVYCPALLCVHIWVSEPSDGYFMFPVSVTMQHLDLCCHVSSATQGWQCRVVSLQQSPLLQTLAQLVTENPFKCPQWMKPTQTSCCLTAICSTLYHQATSSETQSLLTWFFSIRSKHCSKPTVYQRWCLNACMTVCSVPQRQMTKQSPSCNMQSSCPIIRLPRWAPDFFIIQSCVEVHHH